MLEQPIRSVSLKDLAAQVRTAVEEVRALKPDLIHEGAAERLVTGPGGILGFVVKPEIAERLTMAEASELAASVGGKLSPLVGPGGARAVVEGRRIIIGFAPIEISIDI